MGEHRRNCFNELLQSGPTKSPLLEPRTLRETEISNIEIGRRLYGHTGACYIKHRNKQESMPRVLLSPIQFSHGHLAKSLLGKAIL